MDILDDHILLNSDEHRALNSFDVWPRPCAALLLEAVLDESINVANELTDTLRLPLDQDPAIEMVIPRQIDRLARLNVLSEEVAELGLHKPIEEFLKVTSAGF